MFASVKEMIKACQAANIPVWELALRREVEEGERSREEILEDMSQKLDVMVAAVERGLEGVRSYSGLSGGTARLMEDYRQSGRGLSGDLFLRAISYALAVNEVNAAMGIICATPTAGSAGVVPAILMAVRDKLQLSREDQIHYLLTAAAFGLAIGNQTSIAGAEGGCQAEVGAASGMAAAALTWAAGGSLEQQASALAMALMNILGLVCDPVAGLVEIPCIKRNAMGAANALAAAEMALAGSASEIPADEVIEAMGRVGHMLPSALRETAQGGIAVTKTGKRYAKALKKSKKKYLSEEQILPSGKNESDDSKVN